MNTLYWHVWSQRWSVNGSTNSHAQPLDGGVSCEVGWEWLDVGATLTLLVPLVLITYYMLMDTQSYIGLSQQNFCSCLPKLQELAVKNWMKSNWLKLTKIKQSSYQGWGWLQYLPYFGVIVIIIVIIHWQVSVIVIIIMLCHIALFTEKSIITLHWIFWKWTIIQLEICKMLVL